MKWTHGAHPLARSADSCGPGVPAKDRQAAMYVFNFLQSHNFMAPPNHRGNRAYENSDGKLRNSSAGYLEYHVYADSVKPAPPERLVIDRDDVRGNSYFSADHYTTFVQFCLTA